MTRKDLHDNETIQKAIHEYEGGTPAAELCRKYGVARSTFYYWLSKTAETGSTQKDRMVALKAENTRLKIMLGERVLELIMQHAFLSADPQLRNNLEKLLTIEESVINP